MASVGALTIDLKAQTASFQADMGRAARAVQTNTAQMNRSLKTLQTGFVGLQSAVGRFVGLIGVGFGVRFLKQSLDAAGGLGELGEQLGVSTDLLQSMQYAATQAGVGAKELETGIARLTRSIGDAANGEKTYLDAFNRLGIGVLDVNGKVRSTEEVLREFADKLQAIPDPARQAAAAYELMGRGGQRLLTILGNGSAGLDSFIDAAKRAGVVLDETAIRDADKAADKIAEMQFQWSKLAQTLAAEVAPALTKVAQGWQWLLNPSSRPQDSFAAQLAEVNAEIAKLEARANSTTIAGKVRAAEDAPLLAALRARREALLASGPPPSSKTGSGVNPASKDDPTAKAAENAKKRIDELILSLQAEESQIGMTDRAREISQALFKAEAIARAGNIELTDDQRESIAYLTSVIAEGTEEQKRQDEALNRALDGLKVYADTQAEIADNADLLNALQRGTAEYQKQAAYIAILNKYKAAGIEIDDQVKANAREQAEALGEQRDAIDKLKDKYDEWGRTAADATRIITNGLEDAVIRGAKGVDILRAGLEDLARILFRISVTKPFENWASDLARANSAAGGGSSGGGLFGGLFDAIGGIFGGGIAGGMSGGGAGTGTAAGFTEGWFTSGMAFADGGRPPVGQASWVGERGPEMFVPDVAGTIIPNHELGGSGGDSYYIDARGADREGLTRLERMIRQVNGSIERRSVAAVSDARARNPRLLPA